MKNEQDTMKVLALNITGPVMVTKKLDNDEQLHVLCYWEGSDILIHLGANWPHGSCYPVFEFGDTVEIEGEDSRAVEYFEAFNLGPCVLQSLWLGNIGASKLGWAGFRYLTKKL